MHASSKHTESGVSEGISLQGKCAQEPQKKPALRPPSRLLFAGTHGPVLRSRFVPKSLSQHAIVGWLERNHRMGAEDLLLDWK